VGLPRLSRISRPMMSTMAVLGASLEIACNGWLALLYSKAWRRKRPPRRVTLVLQLANTAGA
jgi:hypothetical protein